MAIGLVCLVRFFASTSGSSWSCSISPSSSWRCCHFRDRAADTPFPSKGSARWWWWKLFHPGQSTEFSDVGEFLGNYLGALGRSLILAIVVAILATIMALMAAHAFRKPFRGSNAVFYLWLLGIIVPGITVSLGLFLVLNRLGITPNWKTSALGVHVMWTLPFCLIIFLMAFNRFDLNLEDAALVFGANPLQAYWYVTLPVMQPFILSSLLFGFTLSLDEFQRSLLLTGTTLETQTLPVMIMASVTTRITPTLYALGTLTTLLSFAVIALYIYLPADPTLTTAEGSRPSSRIRERRDPPTLD